MTDIKYAVTVDAHGDDLKSVFIIKSLRGDTGLDEQISVSSKFRWVRDVLLVASDQFSGLTTVTRIPETTNLQVPSLGGTNLDCFPESFCNRSFESDPSFTTTSATIATLNEDLH